MEFVEFKREKKRKKRRCHFAKKHRRQIKIEVKSSKRKNSEAKKNDFVMKKRNIVMQANAFWENYKAAHEWQNRHNLTWWKSRCFALEHENHLLKETIRDLVKVQGFQENITKTYKSKRYCYYRNVNFDFIGNEDEKNADDTFEFQLNEDMMSFLAQSIRHKIELKSKKNGENICRNKDINCEEIGPNAISLVHKINQDAKLLYGEATSRILAMETALQTTIEKHIDKSKPQYWPNIPLKL